MNDTTISWATKTLNVVHGCSKPAAIPESALPYVDYDFDPRWTKPGTSPECTFCYAEELSNRRGWTPLPWLERNEEENVQLHPERFREIGKLPVKPTHLPPSQRERIFICSMGDWAHRLVPDSFLLELWSWMLKYQHIYMLLTKRPERAVKLAVPWPDHIWLGATCGHPATKWRIKALQAFQAAVRFVSVEPLLASLLPIDLSGIDMVIAGLESGAKRRPGTMQAVRELRDECERQRVAFFFKQDGHRLPGQRPYLVEADGRCRQYRQFPGELSAPTDVEPDNPEWHAAHFQEAFDVNS